MFNPYLYGYGRNGYIGDDPAVAAKMMAAQMAQGPAQGMNAPNPAAFFAAQAAANNPPPGMFQMPGMPPNPMAMPPGGMPHPAAFGAGGWPGAWPFWISNAGAGRFDPRMFEQDMPTKLNRMTLALGSTTMAAGSAGTLTTTVQRGIRFRKVVLSGATAADINGVQITSFTANGDNLTAGGGNFPATVYNKVDELDNLTSDFYTSGATVTLNLLNSGTAAATIFGAIVGDVAR